MISPASGILLIADPFFKGSHFKRTVVFYMRAHKKKVVLEFVVEQAI
jgi:putative AlgH/UPF0301 family transcriptional regulator